MSGDIVREGRKVDPQGPWDSHAVAFARAFCPGPSWKASVKRREVEALTRWAQQRDVAPADLCDAHVVEWLACAPRARRTRLHLRRAAGRLFLRHLREAGVSPAAPAPADATPASVLLRRYAEHLRRDRGLAERSVAVYLPYARQLVATTLGTPARSEDLDARLVRRRFLERIHGRPPAYARLVAAAWRSFLRFLFWRSSTCIDLSSALPRIVQPRQPALCRFLGVAEVARVLGAVDRSTPGGRRDYAILLLLARLGLRAGEVASLDVDDVFWREARLVVRRKGGRVHDLPLPADVGAALARYLREDRSGSASRRLFLRRIPPYVGLAGPAAVGHVVRRWLEAAGLRSRSRRGAAHLFRHGLATRMIRQGATIPEIAGVLGHRALESTQLYAKVDFATLRGVALPWPRACSR